MENRKSVIPSGITRREALNKLSISLECIAFEIRKLGFSGDYEVEFGSDLWKQLTKKLKEFQNEIIDAQIVAGECLKTFGIKSGYLILAAVL